MKTHYLLPNHYKTLGWILFFIGLLLGVLLYSNLLETDVLTVNVLSVYNDNLLNDNASFFKIIKNGILDELAALLIITGGLVTGFSKEKIEDEFISKLRMDSLVWALIVNYLILIIAIIFVYDFTFFNVLVFNMFTPLIFYILRFHFLKLKSVRYEE